MLKARQKNIFVSVETKIYFPEEKIEEIYKVEFDTNEDLFAEFELIFEKTDESFMVGYNRLRKNEPMHGYLKVVGTPVKSNY